MNTTSYLTKTWKRINSSFVDRKDQESMTISELSQLIRYLKYVGFEPFQPLTKFETAMLIISIDVDAGSRRLGLVNEGRNDRYVNDRLTEYQIGAIEETALPLFINLFDYLEVPVTLAYRCQLLELGEDVLAPVFQTSVKHDIGCHGHSHRSFTDLSPEEAEQELIVSSVLMSKSGIVPQSFIFPRNKVAHLDLLHKHGYKCYRDRGGPISDGMYIKKCNQLYDIHPSLHVGVGASHAILEKILDISIRRRSPMHIWFHMWSFGYDKQSIQKSINMIFFPFLMYARKKVDAGELSFETMLSSINRLKPFTKKS